MQFLQNVPGWTYGIYHHKIYDATYSESNLDADLLGCNAVYYINTAYRKVMPLKYGKEQSTYFSQARSKTTVQCKCNLMIISLTFSY
jgi:hypothetical protein